MSDHQVSIDKVDFDTIVGVNTERDEAIKFKQKLVE